MKKSSNCIPLIMAAPAIIIGAIAMYTNEIPTVIWVQNVICLIIGGLISYSLLTRNFKEKRKNSNGIILIAVMFLLLTFIDPGMNGVHRWVSIGVIKLNVTFIVVPIIIIGVWEVLRNKDLWLSIVTTIFIAILLALQPDASQLTAFASSMIILLCSKTNKKDLRVIIVVPLIILIIYSWTHLDSLPPVVYVENILDLLKNIGLIWFVLGVVSLVILPIPFIVFPPENSKLLSRCLGVYITIILISTLLGNFPVPLLGYGISPIIGYFIIITWYSKSKTNS